MEPQGPTLIRGEAKLFWKFGGAEGNRTPDLNVANVALSQLSYGPIEGMVSGGIGRETAG